MTLAGLTGSGVNPNIRQVTLGSALDFLMHPIIPMTSKGPDVVSISNVSGSGGQRTFVMKALRAGVAAVLAQGVAEPLLVFAGNFKNHPGMDHDLIADVFKASNVGKMHALTRTLFNNSDNLFNENWDGNQRYCKNYPTPCLPCGSVSKGRGSAIFRPVEYDYHDYFIRVPGMTSTAARAAIKRDDVKYDNNKLERGCEAIKKRLLAGKAPVVGLIYILPKAVRSNGDLDVHGDGGHSVPIVGCNSAATEFLYIDVYPNGSHLKYGGGHAGHDLFPEVCKFLGIFELKKNDPVRGSHLLRAKTEPGVFFAEPNNFLEVVSGPLT